MCGKNTVFICQLDFSHISLLNLHWRLNNHEAFNAPSCGALVKFMLVTHLYLYCFAWYGHSGMFIVVSNHGSAQSLQMLCIQWVLYTYKTWSFFWLKESNVPKFWTCLRNFFNLMILWMKVKRFPFVCGQDSRFKEMY